MTDTQFHLLAGVLAMISVVVLIVALFRDRPKIRRRCPKCWYDLSASGADNRRCSECGYIARCEKKLHKTRRHWRWASVGVMVLLGALAIGITPRVKRDGLWSVAPNTVLILCLPISDNKGQTPQWKIDAFDELFLERLGYVNTYGSPESPFLWKWQWRLLLDKSLNCIEQSKQYRLSSVGRMHYQISEYALLEGIIHDLDFQDRVIEMRGEENLTIRPYISPSYIDSAILFRGGGYATPFSQSVWYDYTIKLADQEQNLNWYYTHRPYRIRCGTGSYCQILWMTP